MLGDRHETVAILDRDGLAHRLVDLIHQCLLVFGFLAFADRDAGNGHLWSPV
jgi:hypothetical protein